MRSREDLQLTGRSRHAAGAADEFAVVDSEYADDTALAFCSRADVAAQAPNVMLHFERWGMEVHAGTYSPPKESKAGILFCPAPDSLYRRRPGAGARGGPRGGPGGAGRREETLTACPILSPPST